MHPVITVLWLLMLAVTLLVVVPLLVVLLARALRAARAIERYAAETLAAAGGIAANTAPATALKETISTAGRLLAGAERLERQAGRLAGGSPESPGSAPAPAEEARG